MRRLTRRLTTLGAFIFLSVGAWADEAATTQELKELRQAVLQQSKQIELLAEQVARLTRAMQTQKVPEEPVPALHETPAKPPMETAPEAPRVEFSSKAQAVPKAEAMPKAEAVAGQAKHTVAKGETLTSIAKQYNIPLADLQNANKIENDRKLQIGQILVVPTAKAPETPDKKVNP